MGALQSYPELIRLILKRTSCVARAMCCSVSCVANKMAIEASMARSIRPEFYQMAPAEVNEILLWRPVLATEVLSDGHLLQRCKFYVPIDAIWLLLVTNADPHDTMFLCDMLVKQMRQGVSLDNHFMPGDTHLSAWCAMYLDHEELFEILLHRQKKVPFTICCGAVGEPSFSWIDIVGSASQNARINSLVCDVSGLPLTRFCRLALGGDLDGALSVFLEFAAGDEIHEMYSSDIRIMFGLCSLSWPEETKRIVQKAREMPELEQWQDLLESLSKHPNKKSICADDRLHIRDLPVEPPATLTRDQIIEVADYASLDDNDKQFVYGTQVFLSQLTPLPKQAGHLSAYVNAGLLPIDLLTTIACKFYDRANMQVFGHDPAKCLHCDESSQREDDVSATLGTSIMNGYVGVVRHLRDTGRLREHEVDPNGWAYRAHVQPSECMRKALQSGKRAMVRALCPVGIDMTDIVIGMIFDAEIPNKCETIGWVTSNFMVDRQRVESVAGERIRQYYEAVGHVMKTETRSS